MVAGKGQRQLSTEPVCVLVCVWARGTVCVSLVLSVADSVNRWLATVFNTWFQTATVSVCVSATEEGKEKKKKKVRKL